MFRKNYIINFEIPSGYPPDISTFEMALKNYEGYAKITSTSWVIVSSKQPIDISNHLYQFLPTGSRLFISKISAPSAWTNVLNGDWLKRNL